MLEVDRIGKRFPNGHEALGQVTLRVAEGEILAVIGASGCGKSTLLRLVAGLDTPTEGRIALDGTALTGPSPKVGVVFQEPRLMPWLTVAGQCRLRPAAHDAARRARAAGRRGDCPRRPRPLRPMPCPRRSPAAWRSARPWPARWSPARPCSCSTSRSARSTP